MSDFTNDELGVPKIVDRATFQAELEALRIREKFHTHEGDAIAAARRRLPMVEMNPSIMLIGESDPVSLLDAFEGRRQLIAYYFMWHTGHPTTWEPAGAEPRLPFPRTHFCRKQRRYHESYRFAHTQF